MSSIWTIRRSATDTKLTGLCAGVAQHWGVDPVLIRVGWALLALSGGIGVVLYVAGWLLIPVEGQDKAPIDDFGSARRWPKELWVALVVVASLVVFAAFGSASPFGVGPALVLAVIWYFGVYRQQKAAPAPTPLDAPPVLPPAPPQFVRYPGPPTPFTEAADAWRQRVEQARRSGPTTGPVPAPPSAAATPGGHPTPGGSTAYTWPVAPPAGVRSVINDPPAHEPPPDPGLVDRQAFLAVADPVGLYAETEVRSPARPMRRAGSPAAKRLRLVSMIVLGLVLGGLGVLDAQGVAVEPAGYFAAALLVVGLTLVAATWFGRTRGLIPVGVVLAGAVLVTAPVSPVTQMTEWQSTTLNYTQVADFPAGGESFDVGQYTLDLSAVPITRDTSYRAQLGAGQMEVIVPPDVNVVVQYQVDAGVVRAYGSEVGSGVDLNRSVSDPAVTDPARPTLTLDLSVDVGELQVQR